MLEQFFGYRFYRHSNHPGGLKQTTAGDMRANKPERMLELAIKGMLPKNTLGRKQGMKLHVYAISWNHDYFDYS